MLGFAASAFAGSQAVFANGKSAVAPVGRGNLQVRSRPLDRRPAAPARAHWPAPRAGAAGAARGRPPRERAPRRGASAH